VKNDLSAWQRTVLRIVHDAPDSGRIGGERAHGE
jgi:hypothetical protein